MLKDLSKLVALTILFVCGICYSGEESVFNVRATKVEYNVGMTAQGTAWAADVSEFGYKKGFYIITAAHVVEQKEKFEVDIGDERLSCKLIKYKLEKDVDVALLKVIDKVKDADSIPKLKIRKESLNMSVYNHYKNKKESTEKIKSRAFLIAAHTQDGDSGSPVLNDDGEVIGLIWGRAGEDTAVVIPACTIIDVIKKD